MYQCEYCNYESFSNFNVKRQEAKRHKHKLNQDFQNPGQVHENLKNDFESLLKKTRFLYKKTDISKTI